MKKCFVALRKFLTSKEARIGVCCALMMAFMSIACFAEDGASNSSEVISAFSTGFQSIVADSKAMIATIVPVALGLAGLIFLIRKAIGWFKSMAK